MTVNIIVINPIFIGLLIIILVNIITIWIFRTRIKIMENKVKVLEYQRERIDSLIGDKHDLAYLDRMLNMNDNYKDKWGSLNRFRRWG